MRILIVDDEPLVRRALKRVAEMKGHEVLEAENGTQGLEVWRRENPRLVFLDVLMPGLSGPQVMKEIGTDHNAKVILISAYSGEYNLEAAKSIGADMFVPKPFDDIFVIFETAERLCQ
ncbi:MAG: response regulator [Bdellovibrionaceae bacterium]|nr:response regulator [Bdellovibrionales bacterium]MCB9084835.1 response regulator [Pseudobdellovibrionaceae bacterium]